MIDTQNVEPPEEYDFPDDLADAEAMLRDVQADVIDIQTQLGNRNRTHPDGVRFTEEEFWEWRHRAAGAWRHRLEELRELKAHVKELRRSSRSSDPTHTPGLRLVDALVVAYRAGDTDEVMARLKVLAAGWDVRP